MNSIRQSSISFILVLALSLFISACGGGPTAGLSLVGDDNNPGNNSSPPIVDLLSNPKPPAPVITTAEATTSSVLLKWTDESPRESGFIIVRDGIKIGETNKNISQYTDLSVLPATTYTYLVVAWNKEGESISLEKLVTTLSLPAPPKWILPEGAGFNSFAVDQTTGDLYAAGSTTGALTDTPNAGATDAFLIKLNPDGTLAWTKQWGTAGYDFDWDMTVFGSEVYLLWNRNDPYGIGQGEKVFSKYDAAGNELLTVELGTAWQIAIAVDQTGVYITRSTTNLDYITKYDHSGLLLWKRAPSYLKSQWSDITVYNGMVYFTGNGLAALNDPWQVATGKSDSFNGDTIWTAEWWSNNRADLNQGISVSVNSSGVYTGGWWGFDSLTPPDAGGGSNPPRCLMLHYDLDGNLLWVRQDSRDGSFHQVVSDNDAAYALGCGGLTKITNDGAVAWQTATVGVSLSLAIFNNVLFVANNSYVISRYDTLTGDLLP